MAADTTQGNSTGFSPPGILPGTTRTYARDVIDDQSLWTKFGDLMAGRFGRNLGLTLLTLFLAFLTLYPTAMLLYGSLHSTPPGSAGEFNLNGYRTMLSAENFTILLN